MAAGIGQDTTAPFDWEALVGVKLFSWVAGIALALAAVFFLRYSVQSGWLQPPVRVAIGVIVGIGLLLACERRAARRYAITANALDASGIVILFSTFFAAHTLWGLIAAGPTFGLLVLVTTVAVLLSIRRDSVFIALLGLVGGFSTPALLASGQDNPLGLFGYLLLLNAGLAWVSYTRGWAALQFLSAAFTVVYQWQWVLSALSAGSMGMAAGIFLVFPLTAGIFLGTLGRRHPRGRADHRLVMEDLVSGGPGTGRVFDGLLALQALLPLLFAVYLAAMPAYAERSGLLFGFLLCLDAGLYAVARWRGPGLLHLAGGASTVLVFLAWCSSGATAWPAILAYVALFVLFYLATARFPPRADAAGDNAFARADGREFGLAVYTAPVLLFMFAALTVIEPHVASPLLPFGVLLGLAAAVSADAVAREDAVSHLFGALLAFGAMDLWYLRYLAPETVVEGIGVNVAMSLLYLVVPVLAIRVKRELRPLSTQAAMSIALAGHVLLAFVVAQSATAVPAWVVCTALAVLTLAFAAAVLEAAQGELQVASVVAVLAILALWTARSEALPLATTGAWAGVIIAAFTLGCVPLCRRVHGEHPVTRHVETAAGVAFVMALFVLLVAQVASAGLAPPTLVIAQLLLIAGLASLAAWRRRFTFVLASAVPAALIAFHAGLSASSPAEWAEVLGVTTPVYLAYLAVAVSLAKRTGTSASLHQAAVIVSGCYFLVAHQGLTSLGYRGVIGLLPLVQALLLGGVLLNLLRLERTAPRVPGRLALIAGAVLAFVTLVVPVQVDEQWLTIGWALESAALAWLYTRIPHRGLFWTAVGLSVVVFVRLVLNPSIFEYAPRGTTPIVNWYLYTYLVAAVAFLSGASWLRRTTTDQLIPGGIAASTLLPAGAAVLLFALLNIEIADFFTVDGPLTFNFSAGLAQDLTYTLGWALFALALLAVGIVRGVRAPRLAAILLLAVTAFKGFLHDTASLHGLYRVFSFVGLAVCLSLVALALQKFVLRPHDPGRREGGEEAAADERDARLGA